MAEVCVNWKAIRRYLQEAIYILGNRGHFRADGELDAGKIKWFLIKSGKGFTLLKNADAIGAEFRKCTLKQQIELIDDEIAKWSQAGMNEKEFLGERPRTHHTTGSWWSF